MATLHKTQTAGGHWYYPDGTPAHRIPVGDDGETRATTLRDAKRLGLYPSVTGILNTLDKPALNDWKMRQCVMACGRLGVHGEVTDDDFRKVKSEAFAQVDKAADLGSRIHAAIEAYLLRQEMPVGEMHQYVSPAIEWLCEKGLRILELEKILVNTDWGFAGCCDLTFEWGSNGIGVLDWKTRKTYEGRPVRAYDGQDMQIAAYAGTRWPGRQHEVLCANIIVSTTEPGRVEVLKHDNICSAWAAFCSATTVWQHQKTYRPQEWTDGNAD